jgi:peptidoglycan/xylan/chitin deacetylase (PgdA/CDA1 family)
LQREDLDAYTDAFALLRLLRRYGMVSEFNIIMGFVGETVGLNRDMTWPQVVAMAGAGMEMESHTSDHQDLGIINAPPSPRGCSRACRVTIIS